MGDPFSADASPSGRELGVASPGPPCLGAFPVPHAAPSPREFDCFQHRQMPHSPWMQSPFCIPETPFLPDPDVSDCPSPVRSALDSPPAHAVFSPILSSRANLDLQLDNAAGLAEGIDSPLLPREQRRHAHSRGSHPSYSMNPRDVAGQLLGMQRVQVDDVVSPVRPHPLAMLSSGRQDAPLLRQHRPLRRGHNWLSSHNEQPSACSWETAPPPMQVAGSGCAQLPESVASATATAARPTSRGKHAGVSDAAVSCKRQRSSSHESGQAVPEPGAADADFQLPMNGGNVAAAQAHQGLA